MELKPAERTRIFAAYGIANPAERTALSVAWGAELQANPQERQRRTAGRRDRRRDRGELPEDEGGLTSVVAVAWHERPIAGNGTRSESLRALAPGTGRSMTSCGRGSACRRLAAAGLLEALLLSTGAVGVAACAPAQVRSSQEQAHVADMHKVSSGQLPPTASPASHEEGSCGCGEAGASEGCPETVVPPVERDPLLARYRDCWRNSPPSLSYSWTGLGTGLTKELLCAYEVLPLSAYRVVSSEKELGSKVEVDRSYAQKMLMPAFRPPANAWIGGFAARSSISDLVRRQYEAGHRQIVVIESLHAIAVVLPAATSQIPADPPGARRQMFETIMYSVIDVPTITRHQPLFWPDDLNDESPVSLVKPEFAWLSLAAYGGGFLAGMRRGGPFYIMTKVNKTGGLRRDMSSSKWFDK